MMATACVPCGLSARGVLAAARSLSLVDNPAVVA
jgi:hypothetical protein